MPFAADPDSESHFQFGYSNRRLQQSQSQSQRQQQRVLREHPSFVHHTHHRHNNSWEAGVGQHTAHGVLTSMRSGGKAPPRHELAANHPAGSYARAVEGSATAYQAAPQDYHVRRSRLLV